MKRIVRRIAGGCLLLAIPILSVPALAQELEDLSASAAPSNAAPNKVGFGASFTGSQQFNTDIDHGGSFSVFRGRFGAALPVRLNDTLNWETQVKYQWDAYNFSKSLDPWGTINTLQPTTLLKWQQSDRLGLYGGATFRFAVESSTDLGRGFTAGGLVGCNFAVSSNLLLGAGVAYVGQIENSSRVLPIITVNWLISDTLRLTAGFLDVATSGYGAEFSWMVAPKWIVGVGAQYHQARFRLDTNGATPNGVGQESSGTWYLSGTWKPTPYVNASVFAGVVTGGGLRLEDNHGRKLFDNNYDTTGMAGGEISVHF